MNSKQLIFSLAIVAILLSACGTAPVEPARVEVTNIYTGEEVLPGHDAGGVTPIGPPIPNEENVKEFLACQMAAIASTPEIRMVSIKGNGNTIQVVPAKVWGCDSRTFDPTAGVLVAATTLAMATVDLTILGYVFVIGVGVYVLVVAVDAIVESGVIGELTTSYSEPAPLPSFGALALGTAIVYSSHVIPELVTGTGSVSFTTYGELATGTEKVYLTSNLNLLNSEATALAMMSGANQTLYATTATMAADGITTWELTAAEWYEMQAYARMASTSMEGVATFPPITWPDWNPKDWEHAANSRHWPILGIMLAVEAIIHTGDHVYFSPTMGYLMITTWDPYVGTIGSIFTTTQDIAGEIAAGTLGTIVPMTPVTIIFPISGKIEAKRIRGCFSYQVWPASTNPFEIVYEPPDRGGKGTCRQLNSNGTGAFNQ